MTVTICDASLPRFTLRRGESGYPPLLEGIGKPPDTLNGIGDPTVLSKAAIAVVGARRATPYGLDCSRVFASHAAAIGLVVVSGGALGCDQAAAQAALDAGGRTVAVLGGGADVVYPLGAAALFRRIVEQGGAIISEQEWGAAPLRPFFVERNRIIAGLCAVTLIVEAGLPSGTFSTADAALDTGRDLLVVPGNIHSPQSRGSNRLLFQGAQPIIDLSSFDEVVEQAYGFLVLQSEDRDPLGPLPIDPVGKASDRAKLLEALAACPLHLDELARKTGLPRDTFTVLVSECEAFGLLERGRDGRYHVRLH